MVIDEKRVRIQVTKKKISFVASVRESEVDRYCRQCHAGGASTEIIEGD